MNKEPRAAIEAVLEAGEQVLWAGAPDREVMLKTLGKRRRSPVRSALVICIIAAIAWSQRGQLGHLQVGGLGGADQLLIPLLAGAGITALILFLRRRQATGHVDNLAYGITDRRVLILRKGDILEQRTPAQLKWAELQDRAGAAGYSDIIWATRPIATGSGSTQTTPIERERARVGFKALRDGPAVFDRIERWRADHSEAAVKAAEATVKVMTGDDDVPRLVHPRLAMSIATPPGWTVSVRRKTFPFGKTRIDLHADRWYDPGDDDGWNVVRLNDGANAEVMVEAVMSEPIASFEAMANPRVPEAVKRVMQVVDTEQHVTIGGIGGFRVDLALSGKGDTPMAIGERSDKVQSLFRQYVLHDGAYQYYITASWPRGSESQAAACQAIVDSFRGCAAMVA